jgi:hypothetical protein
MAIASWTVEEVRAGLIRPFYGLRADIPAGWVECDGSNGTPDLRGVYPKGAADGQEANVTGGNLTHSHTSHSTVTNLRTGGTSIGFNTNGETHDTVNHEPPYRTCIWIMKT